MSQELSNLFFLYREHGICCIPTLPKDKRPAIPSWRRYQDNLPSDHDCKIWGGQLEVGLIGVGLVCGPISGIVALDLDSDEFLHRLPLGACGKKGQRGETRFFEYTNEASEYLNPPDGRPGIEVKAKGFYTVIPPSIHPAGMPYTWTGRPLIGAELTQLDPAVLQGFRDEWQLTIDTTINQAHRLGVSVLDLAGMLSHINCANLSPKQWLDVAMGVNYEFGAEGWQIFDSWSQTDPARYNKETNRTRWNSFTSEDGKKVTLNTVIKLATERGWRMPEVIIVEETEDRPVYPVPKLPDELILRAPGILRRLIDDIYEGAPTPNLDVALAGAIAATAGFKSHRVMSETGLRPTAIIAAVSGSGTGKEAPAKYIKALFSSIEDNLQKGGKTEKKKLSELLAANLASGQGLVSVVKDGRCLLLWDEIGPYLIQAATSTTSSSQNIITRLTEMSTKSDSFYTTDAYANHDGKQCIEHIAYPHISLYGATTHVHIFKALEAIGLGGGFWARMLFIFGPVVVAPKTSTIKQPDGELVRDIQDWLSRNPQNSASPRIMKLCPLGKQFIEAKKWEIYARAKKAPPLHHEFLNRIIERTIQLTLIAWDGGPDAHGVQGWTYDVPVPVEIVEWSYSVVDWLVTNFIERAMPNRYARSEGERVRGRILLALEEWPRSEKLLRKELSEFSTVEIKEALDWLVDQDEIRVAQCKSRSGRGQPFDGYVKVSKV